MRIFAGACLAQCQTYKSSVFFGIIKNLALSPTHSGSSFSNYWTNCAVFTLHVWTVVLCRKHVMWSAADVRIPLCSWVVALEHNSSGARVAGDFCASGCFRAMPATSERRIGMAFITQDSGGFWMFGCLVACPCLGSDYDSQVGVFQDNPLLHLKYWGGRIHEFSKDMFPSFLHYFVRHIGRLRRWCCGLHYFLPSFLGHCQLLDQRFNPQWHIQCSWELQCFLSIINTQGLRRGRPHRLWGKVPAVEAWRKGMVAMRRLSAFIIWPRVHIDSMQSCSTAIQLYKHELFHAWKSLWNLPPKLEGVLVLLTRKEANLLFHCCRSSLKPGQNEPDLAAYVKSTQDMVGSCCCLGSWQLSSIQYLCGKKQPICQDYHFWHTLNSSGISKTHAKKYWENKCIMPQLEPRSALSIFLTTSRYQPQCAGGWSAPGELPGLTDFTCHCRTVAW